MTLIVREKSELGGKTNTRNRQEPITKYLNTGFGVVPVSKLSFVEQQREETGGQR